MIFKQKLIKINDILKELNKLDIADGDKILLDMGEKFGLFRIDVRRRELEPLSGEAILPLEYLGSLDYDFELLSPRKEQVLKKIEYLAEIEFGSAIRGEYRYYLCFDEVCHTLFVREAPEIKEMIVLLFPTIKQEDVFKVREVISELTYSEKQALF